MTHHHAPSKESASLSQLDCLASDATRRLVREATRTDHQRLDRAMSTLELGDPVGYGMFLKIHYTALTSLARRWRAEDQPAFSALLSCVIDDLQALGHPVRYPAASIKRVDSLRPWGIAYVIRGSRLGGQVLGRRVPGAFPKSYLDCVPTLPWPDFLKQLDEAGGSNPDQIEQIIRGAKIAFAAFIAAAGKCGVL